MTKDLIKESTPMYLDYAATTPVDPRVVDKMIHSLSHGLSFGNSHSHHQYGKAALGEIENARQQVADLIQTQPRNIIFTSGATESNNIAIQGVARFYGENEKGRHIVTSLVEHPSVLETCQQLEKEGFEVTYLKPSKEGIIEMDSFNNALREDTILVTLMHVNNETGVMQDIKAISKETRARGILFHVDAAQSVGKVPIDLNNLNVDLMSFSAHKIYGPKGIGALYIGDKPKVRLKPVFQGGGQERGIRPGTMPTHQIVGIGEAFSIAREKIQTEGLSIEHKKNLFWDGIKDIPGVYLNGHPTQRIPGILNIRFEVLNSESINKDNKNNKDKEEFMANLSNIAFSRASACRTGAIEPSYVLRAMGLTDKQAHQSLRFSIGRFTTEDEIKTAIQLIRGACQ